MPPQLALALTCAFSGFLVWRESRHDRMDLALWLPLIWVLLIGSRFPSQWLATFGLGGDIGGATLEDGSPLDAAIFLLLIIAGIGVLVRRHLSLIAFARQNVWIVVFLAYCFLAILWSDFPFVAFKRWVKILGHPVMALIILTSPQPTTAMRQVFKRSAFVLIPFSVLFIKYYPEIGRYFDDWSGAGMNRGLNLNKNELGYVCMTFGLFFVWNLLCRARVKQVPYESALSVMLLALIGWLFLKADSATAITCFGLGALGMIVLGSPLVSHRYIGTYVLVALVIAGWAELTFGLYGRFVEALGRDSTLTDRTILWDQLLDFQVNSLLGAGFESFWLGERLAAMWERWPWRPNQAHSGYLETYLNLGGLGVALLAALLLDTFLKSRRALIEDEQVGRLRFAFLLVIVFYNYTEASFKGVHLLWTMFYLTAVDYRSLVHKAAPVKLLMQVGQHRRSAEAGARRAPKADPRTPGYAISPSRRALSPSPQSWSRPRVQNQQTRRFGDHVDPSHKRH